MDKSSINWHILEEYKLQHMSVSKCNTVKTVYMHFAHKDFHRPVIKVRLIYKGSDVLEKHNNIQEVATTLTFLAEKMTQSCIELYKAVEPAEKQVTAGEPLG